MSDSSALLSVRGLTVRAGGRTLFEPSDFDLAAHPAHQIGVPRMGRPEHLDYDPLERRQPLRLEHDPGPAHPDGVPNPIATIQKLPP